MQILLIEDEHKIANVIKRGLEQASHVVSVVYDETAALQKVDQASYDVVVVDDSLSSGTKGSSIIATMRAKQNHTPVLLLTTKEKTHTRTKVSETSADEYLVKPFSVGELTTTIESLTHQTPSSLVYGDLALDPQSYGVTRKNKPVELTQREFSLLEYLMRNPGKILTKDMITRYVWDYDANILPNTVEVYMGYIRNKVEKPFSKEPLIRTRRGFGYIFGKAE